MNIASQSSRKFHPRCMDVTGATAVAHEKTSIDNSRGRRRRDLIINGHYDDDTTDMFDLLRSVRDGRILWEDGFGQSIASTEPLDRIRVGKNISSERRVNA